MTQSADASPAAEESTDRTRRWAIRALVGGSFAVPLLVEGRTVLKLLGEVGGGGGDEGDAAAGGTSTDGATGVGTGDELLGPTRASETVRAGTLRDRDGGRTFELVVAVENRDSEPYALELGRLDTTARSVDGGRTVRVPAGESRTVTGRWSLPADATPTAVYVEGRQHRASGGVQRISETVALAESLLD
jgi:hypothetical protein